MPTLLGVLQRAWFHRPVLTTPARQRAAIDASRSDGVKVGTDILNDALRIITGNLRRHGTDYDWYAYADGIADTRAFRTADPTATEDAVPAAPRLRLVTTG